MDEIGGSRKARDAAETAAWNQRLGWPKLLVVLALLVAAGAGVWAEFGPILEITFSCSGKPLQGENIYYAVVLSVITAPLGVFVVPFMRAPLSLLVASLSGAGLLTLAIAFLALDSATFIQQGSTCMLGGNGAGYAHLALLYYLWGGALAVVLFQAALLFRWRVDTR
jgi:hypothetical protein